MKRTDKKVLVKNGRQILERCVYVDGSGRECFKYNGVVNYICEGQGSAKGTYYAPWFTWVRYI